MKKLIYAISALAIVLAVGCSEDKVQTPEREYKLVVNMDKASLGDTTRAPRNSWLEGDEVMLFFGSDCSKWMTIKYDGNNWSIIDEDQSAYIAELAERENKSLTAIYCLHNDGELLPLKQDGAAFFLNVFNGQQPCGTLFMTCENGSYSVDGDIFTINATLSLPNTDYGQYAQFTIRNISNDNDVNWFLVEDGNQAFQPCCGVVISCGGDNKLSIEYILPGVGEAFLQGYNTEDGVAFYGVLYNEAIGKSVDYNFALINSRGEKFTKTYTSKTLNAGSAVIFNGPNVSDGVEELNGWKRVQ